MMIVLDADAIRNGIPQQVLQDIPNIRTFDSIDSTNDFLLQAAKPMPGMMNVAATTNQTAGRGRHGKVWHSPAGFGLCLSVAYTFAARVNHLPAMTLALGLAAREALAKLGATGLQLKWPNDLVAMNDKLAGILTEVQEQTLGGATIVAGIGVNVDIPEDFAASVANDWERRAVGMKSLCKVLPSHEEIAARLVIAFLAAFRNYEQQGFAPLVETWSRYDWLSGRRIQVSTANRKISGLASGIGDDGALLIKTQDDSLQRITSGTIVSVEPRTGNSTH